MKLALLHENEGTNFSLFIMLNSAKISASGQTCGQVRKMGLFNPQSREEQAHCVYHENARFQEIWRENKKRKGYFRNDYQYMNGYIIAISIKGSYHAINNWNS